MGSSTMPLMTAKTGEEMLVPVEQYLKALQEEADPPEAYVDYLERRLATRDFVEEAERARASA